MILKFFLKEVFIRNKFLLLSIFFVFSLYDMKKFIIPNSILFFSILTIFLYTIFEKILFGTPIQILFPIKYTISLTIFIILRLFINIPSGDIKIFSVVIGLMNYSSALVILFISLIIALLIIIASRRRVPLAPCILIGSFSFFIIERVI